MPGPKPSAQIIFNRIYVELLRLRILCETDQQNNVLDQMEQVTLKVMPLWTNEPLSLPIKPRLSNAEQNKQYLDAEAAVLAKYGVTKPPKPPR